MLDHLRRNLKFHLFAFGTISFLVTCALGLGLPSPFSFRSQNILYHFGLAKMYRDGDFGLSRFQSLAHAQLPHGFVDQHFLYHVFLSIWPSSLNDDWILLITLAAGIILAGFSIYLLLREYSDLKDMSTLNSAILASLSVSIFVLDPRIFTRITNGRPGPFQIAILFLLLLSVSQRDRKQILVFVLSLIWASFSYLSLLAPALVFIFPAKFKTRVQSAIVSAAGILIGYICASGFKVFSYIYNIINAHVFSDSGIFEWSASSRNIDLLPILLVWICSLKYLWNSKERSLSSAMKDRSLALVSVASFFALLTLKYSRFIEIALPLSVTSFLIYFLPDIKRLRFGKGGLALLLITFFSIQVYRFSKLDILDYSYKPNDLATLNLILPELKGKTAILSDWTSWSAAFYLDQKTKLEPGFSMSLYPGHIRKLHARLQGGLPLDYAEMSVLLNFFQTDLLILPNARAKELSFPTQNLGTFYGSSLVRVPRPLDYKTSELCEDELAGFEVLYFDEFMNLVRSSTREDLESKKDCLELIERETQKQDGPTLIRVWKNPRKLENLNQIQTSLNQGRFGIILKTDTEPMKFLASEEITGLLNQPDVNSEAVEEHLYLLPNSNITWRGRVPEFKSITPKLICSSYQSAVGAFLDKADQRLKTLETSRRSTERIRHFMAFHSVCLRPKFANLNQKRKLAEVCSRFTDIIETLNLNLGDNYSVAEAVLLDLISSTPPQALSKLKPEDLLHHGRVATSVSSLPHMRTYFGASEADLFSSGQFALWWQKRGFSLDGFDEFAEQYHRFYRTDFNYNVFSVRWWSESLAKDYQIRKSSLASDWMHEFFRATESMIKGPSLEAFPGCLGPRAPGLGDLPFPNHNASLLLEGLGYARSADFPWWSDKEEQLLLGLLKCSISLQARAPFWPANIQGEILQQPGLHYEAPDIQGHFINALGLRLEQDEIQCQ